MSDIKKIVQQELRGVARVVTQKADTDVVVAVQVVDDDTILLWDSVYHNFVLEVDEVVQNEDGLLVKASGDTWALRRLSDERAASFKKSMKEAGFIHG